MNAKGWAAIRNGEILVDTVSPHRRAAIVNWLWVYGGQTVLDRYTDEVIEMMWEKATKIARQKGVTVDVAEVVISLKVI